MKSTSIKTPHQGNGQDTSEKRGVVRETLREFSSTSTLHGLRYISDPGLTRFEKAFWSMITVASVCVCVWACGRTWLKWQDRPIIISVDDRLMSVAEIPFPAVTICPQTRQKTFNFTKQYIDITKDFRMLHSIWPKDFRERDRIRRLKSFTERTPFVKKIFATSFVCDKLQSDIIYYLQSGDDQDIVQHIVEEALTMKDLMVEGKWRHKQMLSYRPSDFFTPVLTAEGQCYTFNSLAADELFNLDRIHKKYAYSGAFIPSGNWSSKRDEFFFEEKQDGDEKHIVVDGLYPWRGEVLFLMSITREIDGYHYPPGNPDCLEEKSVYETEFNLVLGDPFAHDLQCSSASFQGFKVYLHHPAELPRRTNNFYAAEPDHLVTLKINAKVITTSDSLINYPLHVRQCYFPKERALHYFKVYTTSSCELECLTNFTFERCKCVWFHMPHNDTTNICTSSDDVGCYLNVVGNFATSGNWLGENGCQCLPLCNSIQYEAETSKTDYKYKSEVDHRVRSYFEISPGDYRLNPKTLDFKKYSYTGIQMSFKEPRFVTMRRSELYGSTDFLANCGGLLGLFLGFSFLSLVELIYFFTLRLFYMLRRQNKSGDKQNGNAMLEKEKDVYAQELNVTRF